MLSAGDVIQLIQSLIWLLAGVSIVAGVTAIIQSSSAISDMVTGLDRVQHPHPVGNDKESN